MSDCIFCKIVNNEIPGKIVYEDTVCIAFLDISQTTKGHTLVIPKKHFENFLEVDVDTLQHMIAVTQTLAKKIVYNTNATGCNIITNAGLTAGQTVFHFHIHIIPRYDEKDTITISFTDNSQDVNLEDIYQLVQK